MAEEVGTGIFCGSDWWDWSRTMPFANPLSTPCYGATVFDDVGSANLINCSMSNLSGNISTPRSCREIRSDSTARVSGKNNFNFVMNSSIWDHGSSGRAGEDNNIDRILQEDMASSQFQTDWSPKSFQSVGILGDSSMNAFKHINQEFSNNFDQSDPAKCTSPSCQQGFPTNAFPFGCSSMTQSLMEPQEIVSNHSAMMNFFSFETTNQSYPTGTKHLEILENRWIGLGEDVSSPRQVGFPLLREEVACKNGFIMKHSDEEMGDLLSQVKEGEYEPAYKRPRIETPLPMFKVRKEKLGDRVTALQQLVSPFGKNDTASVLNEAVDYIKFLHDQLNALMNEHLKNGVSIQNYHQVTGESRDGEEPKQYLRSRGLCLVPISTTYAVANETRADNIWTPNLLGGSFL